MTFEDYITEVAEQSREHPEWRHGQTAFNVLYRLNPELATRIRGTGMDPFYLDDISRVTTFYLYVARNWERNDTDTSPHL